MNIDQALIALCEKHDLTSLKVGPTRSSHRANGYVFVAYANYEHGGQQSAKQGIQPTSAEAIAHAIQQVNEARACVVDVPAMELDDDLNDPTECMNTEEYIDYVNAGAA